MRTSSSAAYVAVGLMIAALSACGAKIHSASAPQLAKRASFDLECPENQLQVTKLGESRGVTGCGRKAVYIEHCDGDPRAFTTSCDWALNSDVSGPPAEAPAPKAKEAPAAAPATKEAAPPAGTGGNATEM